MQCQRLGCEWCYRDENGTVMKDEKKYCGKTGACPFIPPTPILTSTSTTNQNLLNTSNIPPTEKTHLSDGVIAAIAVGSCIVVYCDCGFCFMVY